MISVSGCRVVAMTAALALVGCAVVAGRATAGERVAAATITSLAVSGNPAKPIFTVTGTGLTVPAPNPSTSPSGQQLCPLKISGNAGLNYGTRFYLVAWDAQAVGTDKQLYAAGRYRPALNELDCIGIVVLSHTPTKVSFTFGRAYAQYRSQYRALRSGDVIEVVLNTAAYATVVRYG